MALAYNLGFCVLKSDFKLISLNSEFDVNTSDNLIQIKKLKETFDINTNLKFVRRFYEFDGLVESEVFKSDSSHFIKFNDGLSFKITKKSEILIFEPTNYDQEKSEHILLNRILPLALSQFRKDSLVFHTSAVQKNGKTILFAGKSGQGKSTLSYFLSQNDFQLISDDFCVITEEDNKFFAIENKLSIRLWPNSLKILGLEGNYKRIHNSSEKLSLRNISDSEIKNEKHLISTICILDEKIDEPEEFHAEDLIQLISFLFVLDPNDKVELDTISRLTKTVKCLKLPYKRERKYLEQSLKFCNERCK